MQKGLRYYRLIERFIALLLVLILFPLFLLTGVILLITFGKPPIIKQLRAIALEDKHFYLYKFRTLYDSINSSIKRNEILEKNLEFNPTNFIGKILRLSNLDELPQLFNIIKGEMSFFGPRPFLLGDLLYFKNTHPELYKLRLNSGYLKPGLTGYWQIIGKREFGFYELVYMDKKTTEANFLNKLEIVLFTLMKCVTLSSSDALVRQNNNITTLLNKFIIKKLKIKKEICHVSITNYILTEFDDKSYTILIPTNSWSSIPLNFSAKFLSKLKKGA